MLPNVICALSSTLATTTTINSKIIHSINTNTTFFAYATDIIDESDMKMGNTQRSNSENNGKSPNQGSSKCCGSFSTLVLYLLVIAALLLVSFKWFYFKNFKKITLLKHCKQIAGK